MTGREWMTTIRLLLSAALIYVAVYRDQRWALAVLLALIVLAQEQTAWWTRRQS